jgi:hypothetical protein
MATDTVVIEKKPNVLKRTFETGNTRYVVEAEIKPAQIVAPYLTVDLLPADKGSKSLSITASIYERNKAGRWECRGGGQATDELREAFPNEADVQRLCEIWDKYHLCDMKSGSREQNAIIDEWAAKGYPKSATPGRYDYMDACTLLENAGRLEVPIPAGPNEEADEEGLALLTDGTGRRYRKLYKYGSAWLSDSLPVEIEAEVIQLMTVEEPKASPEAENRASLAKLGIKMSVQRADRNPNMDHGDPCASHYKCTFSRGRKRMTVYFSMGSAHTSEPTINEVFDCLVEDARSVDDLDFDEWCRDLGYDTDSRKGERMYKTCVHQAGRLRSFLGDELYNKFLES